MAAVFPLRLTDGTGFVWDMQYDGRIGNGTSDAFDGGFDLYNMPYVYSYDLSTDGRQATLTAMSSQNDAEIEYERSLYVPVMAGWARFVDTATNLGTEAVIASVSVRTDLGSNYGTQVLATSSGDLDYTSEDVYLITDDGVAAGDPNVGMAFGDGTRAPDVTLISHDDVVWEYQVLLEPGESFSVISFGVQGYDTDQVTTTLASLTGALTEEMLAGIAPETYGQIVNYNPWASVTEMLAGDSGDDALSGTDIAEMFLPQDGNDTVLAAGGGDTIEAGAGNDIVYAGDGVDRVWGGDGNDILFGEADADTMSGDDGDDVLDGGYGNDALDGGAGADTLRGQVGDDRLDGGSEADRLEGGAGADILLGGTGNDHLTGGAGADLISGGEGVDWASYAGSSEAVEVDLFLGTATGGDATGDQLSGIENVEGTAFDDALTGNEADNVFLPGAGVDRIDGGDGFDTVDYSAEIAPVTVSLADSGAGGDILLSIEQVVGSAFDDSIFSSAASETIYAGHGDDHISTGGGADQVWAGAGDDTILGNRGDEILDGGEGDDTISGEGGIDWIDGGTGWNVLDGGDGDDTIVGGAWVDRVFGGDGNDRLEGNKGYDHLDGGSGDDVLFGGLGSDTLVGGDGDDWLNGGDQPDVLTGGAGADTFVFAQWSQNDVITDFEDGIDQLDLTDLGIESFEAMLRQVWQSGDDVLLRCADAGTLRLENYTLGDLDAGDVIL